MSSKQVSYSGSFFLRHGTASHDSYNEDMYRTLLEGYQQLQQEMASVAAEWQECEKRIDDYVDEQVYTSKTTFDTENNSTLKKKGGTRSRHSN